MTEAEAAKSKTKTKTKHQSHKIQNEAKKKRSIVSETTGRGKWHQKERSLEDEQIKFFRNVDKALNKENER